MVGQVPQIVPKALELLRMDQTSGDLTPEEAGRRFDLLVRRVLSVPHAEIMRREAEYQKTRPGLTGNKRGRKPKPTSKI
jgi:hypothetical protein